MEESRKTLDRANLDSPYRTQESERSKPPKKEGKSTFDELLEQNRLLQQGSLDAQFKPKGSQQQSVASVEKFKEKFRESTKEREKEESQKQETRDEKNRMGEPAKKIVGKNFLKHDSGGQNQKGSQDGSGLAKKERRLLTENKRLTNTNSLEMKTSHEFAKALQETLKKQNLHLPKTLSQEILNHIIRHVKIGLNEKGQKEIDLVLHRNVFKGLRLRLSVNHGKVNVHFLTANGGVKELFLREKSAIESALKEKGIAVEEILVT